MSWIEWLSGDITHDFFKITLSINCDLSKDLLESLSNASLGFFHLLYYPSLKTQGVKGKERREREKRKERGIKHQFPRDLNILVHSMNNWSFYSGWQINAWLAIQVNRVFCVLDKSRVTLRVREQETMKGQDFHVLDELDPMFDLVDETTNGFLTNKLPKNQVFRSRDLSI